MHTCHAIECKQKVAPAMLMCKRHWFSVPKPIRDAVWANYRQGQTGDWRPTKEYCESAKAAVKAAAEREGRVVTGEEHELKLYDIFTPKEK